MRQQKQLLRHDPESGIYGDCVRAVYACLLDLDVEEVPHFLHDDPPSGVRQDRINLWLQSRGYASVTTLFPGDTPLVEVHRHMGVMNPGVYHTLWGTSRNGCGHVVICLGDAIYWDTSREDSGIVAPLDGYWWVEFLVPINMTTKRPVSDEVREAHRPAE